MSVRSLNGLSSIYVNTIQAGDAISVSSSGTSISTVNLDISKQSANTTIAATDLFVLEDNAGNIKKITGANMKSELEQSTVVSPLLLTGNAISIKGLSGFTANKFLKVNSAGDAIEYADSTNTVVSPLLLTGNSVSIKGLSGFTANKFLKVNSAGDAIEYADDNDTNFWTYSSPSLRPDNTADNILLGTTSNTNSRKLIVVGNTELQDLYIQSNKKIISTNDSDDYLQFGNNTFTNNYASNIFSRGIAFLAGDLQLPSGSAISLGASSTDKITFNSGNFTFGNAGIFNNSIQVKSTNSSNSGNVSFFEASANGTNNIDLHSPETLTHDYNAYLPKITNTGITNVYILSNQNVLAGTNVSISGTETITINSTDTNTEYTGGTNITLAGTQFNLDTTLTGAMTFSNTITFSAVPVVNQTLQLNGGNLLPAIIDMYDINGNFALSIRSQDTIPANRDLTLPAVSANDFLLSRTSTDTLSNKTFNDLTTFNLGLAVKNSIASVSGGVQFYNKDNDNYVDLRLQNEDVDSDITVFLPTTLDNTVLVGQQTTDILQNKTFNSNTQFNLAIQLFNIQASAITSSLSASQTGLVLTGSTIDVDTNMKIRNSADQDDYIQIGDDITFNFNNMKVKQDSKLVNTSNTECFLKFENTLLTNTFHRSEFVKLTIKKNDGYSAGPENGYIELVETASSSSNTTRLYFNNAGTAYIYFDGTNLVATQNTFSSSDMRLKKNETKADINELCNAFDNIDIYKYQYEEQYAIDKGADPNKYVYGFIAQNVKEQTDNLSSQFATTGKGQAIYPNEKIDYEGDKLVVDNVLTINKTDMNLLLWGKIKQMDAIIQQQQTVINNLLNATSFANFKKM